MKICKSCGIGGLHWIMTERGWRLADTNNDVHSCLTQTDRTVHAVITLKKSEVPILLFAIDETLPQFKDGTKQKRLITSIREKLVEFEDDND